MLKLDQTKLQCFKVCPRQFYWRFVKNLELKAMPSQALSFGTLAHKFVEDFYCNDNKDRFGAAIKQFEQTLEVNSSIDQLLTIEEKIKLEESFDFVKTATQAYKAGYEANYKDDISKYTVLGKEKMLEFALSSDFTLFGTLDAILRDNKTNKIILMETKTTSNLGASYLEKLALDTQITTYVYLMIKNGMKPDEILYDIIRKTRMRRREKDSWQDYGNRLYQDMLENPKEYFYRENLIRDDTALQDFEDQLISLKATIDRCTSYGIKDFWQNTSSCSNYEGCEYFKLCSFGEQNATIFYRERKEIKNEL